MTLCCPLEAQHLSSPGRRQQLSSSTCCSSSLPPAPAGQHDREALAALRWSVDGSRKRRDAEALKREARASSMCCLSGLCIRHAMGARCPRQPFNATCCHGGRVGRAWLKGWVRSRGALSLCVTSAYRRDAQRTMDRQRVSELCFERRVNASEIVPARRASSHSCARVRIRSAGSANVMTLEKLHVV